ncbi:hypothetical protein AVEN_160674-1, partial [Araneus ventricosus]
SDPWGRLPYGQEEERMSSSVDWSDLVREGKV